MIVITIVAIFVTDIKIKIIWIRIGIILDVLLSFIIIIMVL